MTNRRSTNPSTTEEARRTVIPAPKNAGMFAGWGVRF